MGLRVSFVLVILLTVRFKRMRVYRSGSTQPAHPAPPVPGRRAVVGPEVYRPGQLIKTGYHLPLRIGRWSWYSRAPIIRVSMSDNMVPGCHRCPDQ